ncbi:MAG: hypothetical protein KF727_12780 [Microbacteriaceae bacterium]|nr:hypothetical protein [Microbacteriaceae bacterium]
MSDTIEVPMMTAGPALHIEWLSADHGLWVATGLSERNSLMHLGRVDQVAGLYTAYDRIGAALGTFETLGEAKAQVELHH